MTREKALAAYQELNVDQKEKANNRTKNSQTDFNYREEWVSGEDMMLKNLQNSKLAEKELQFIVSAIRDAQIVE